jgi:hypothetical protein
MRSNIHTHAHTNSDDPVHFYIQIIKVMSIRTHKCTRRHQYWRTPLHIEACLHTHTHIYIHIYIYTHTHTHTHTYVFTHTHTHAHTHIWDLHCKCPAQWGVTPEHSRRRTRRVHQHEVYTSLPRCPCMYAWVYIQQSAHLHTCVYTRVCVSMC